MGELISPTAPPAGVTASSAQTQLTATEARADSPTSPAADEAATLPPRLIDSDPSRYRSLKQVIVIGSPGSGVDGIGDALRKLGMKVYDFKAASDRYERDFPLWLEAARLQSTKQAYNKSDYDKVIGDYNALVGLPMSLFDHEFIKLYPNVKVILMTRCPDYAFIKDLFARTTSHFWQTIDPTYFGKLHRLFAGNAMSSQAAFTEVEEQRIRMFVKERNLLEIRNLIAWMPLCQFLSVPVPDTPTPELHDNTIKAVLAARPQCVLTEKALRGACWIIATLKYILVSVSVTLIAVLAVSLGIVGLLQLSSVALHLLSILVARSKIRDVTRLLAAGIALSALTCGLAAGYGLALFLQPKAIPVDSAVRDERRKPYYGRRKSKQDPSKRPEHDENTRLERPTVPSWSGVQESIRKDDVAMKEEGKAAFEEWKDRRVTFNVTHKQTESGLELSNGPRKIVLTEQAVE